MGIKEQVFKQSIEIYGKEAQCRQAMEECAELIQAINKCLRYPDKKESKPNLIEEIADVEIMIFQLKEMFNIDDNIVENYKFLKATREKRRLAGVKNMESEKALEQEGFSKTYESRNIVGFVSGEDMLKFYKDSKGVSICDKYCEAYLSAKLLKAIYLYYEEKGLFK